MKTYTATQKKLLDRNRLNHIYLIEITLKNSGPTLYFSDRNITVGGQIYENYLSSLDGLGDEIRRATSESLNTNIKLNFKNDRYKGYQFLILIDDTYPFTGAEMVAKEVYLDDNNNPSEAFLIFKGTLDEPRDIDEQKFICAISSMEYRKDLSNR
ncbi:MAG: hypothetical protein HZB61_10385 [Nitrospirae bacterium]|nr:hypothetical protein [Nitrospirota bacterium]